MSKKNARILAIDDDRDVPSTANMVLKQHFSEVITLEQLFFCFKTALSSGAQETKVRARLKKMGTDKTLDRDMTTLPIDCLIEDNILVAYFDSLGHLNPL
jgi:hypothetical protein